MIGTIHNIGHRAASQFGNGARRSHFHFFVDGRSSHIQRTAENIGETNDIIDLIGIVRAPRRH